MSSDERVDKNAKVIDFLKAKRRLNYEDEKELIEEWSKWPITEKVSRSGWRGIIHMAVSASKCFDIEFTPELVLLLANCITNYETFKEEFPDE